VDYLRSIRGPVESALFSWDDPLPGLLDLPLFANAAADGLWSHKGPVRFTITFFVLLAEAELGGRGSAAVPFCSYQVPLCLTAYEPKFVGN